MIFMYSEIRSPSQAPVAHSSFRYLMIFAAFALLAVDRQDGRCIRAVPGIEEWNRQSGVPLRRPKTLDC